MYDADKIACENHHELFSKTPRVGYRISRGLVKVSWAFSILMRKKSFSWEKWNSHERKTSWKFSSDFENSHEKVIFSWESHEILMRKQKLTRSFVRADFSSDLMKGLVSWEHLIQNQGKTNKYGKLLKLSKPPRTSIYTRQTAAKYCQGCVTNGQ